MYPYMKNASQKHIEWVSNRTNVDTVLPLQFINRMKLSTWINVVLGFSALTALMVGVFLTCKNLMPFEFMTSWEKAKVVLALFIISFS
jgi:hypothetical protein